MGAAGLGYGFKVFPSFPSAFKPRHSSSEAMSAFPSNGVLNLQFFLAFVNTFFSKATRKTLVGQDQ